jgi:tetratricopeptide (TPR) repeat protein
MLVPKASEHYERFLEIERKVGDVRGKERTLNALGKVYEKWGQPSKARQYYEKARDIKSNLERVKVKDRP